MIIKQQWWWLEIFWCIWWVFCFFTPLTWCSKLSLVKYEQMSSRGKKNKASLPVLLPRLLSVPCFEFPVCMQDYYRCVISYNWIFLSGYLIITWKMHLKSGWNLQYLRNVRRILAGYRCYLHVVLSYCGKYGVKCPETYNTVVL